MTVGDGSPVPYTAIDYSYDTRGNILSKTYTLTDGTTETINYGYTCPAWKDRLTVYNGVGINFDLIGNPATWHDGSSMTWQRGRQLASYTDSNGVKTTYTYDDAGIRTSKTTGGVTTKYYVIDGTLRRMSDGTNTLQFVYGNGLSSVIFNDTEYWFVFNAQGDVIGLIDATGTYVVEYTYDAWGKPLSKTGSLADTLGTLNPFRYRGYIYDEETGFYYVSSRYYDSAIGRWINADGQISGVGGDVRGYNQFAYCFNNPVNMSDPTGNWPTWGQVFTAVATVAVAAVVVAAVVASAGAVGVAAGVAAASIGATGTMIGAAYTAGVVGTYVVAAGIGACALSNAGEILTGTNIIRDGLMGGNQEAYDTLQTGLSIAGGGAMMIGQTNPGVTGNSTKPSQNAQTVHKVPTISTPNTSFDKLYAGKNGDFQRTYYDFRGNISLQIDFTQHTKLSEHSYPHLHIWGKFGHSKQINLWYLE